MVKGKLLGRYELEEVKKDLYGSLKKPWLEEYNSEGLAQDLEKIEKAGIKIEGEKLKKIANEIFEVAEDAPPMGPGKLTPCGYPLTTLQRCKIMRYSIDMLKASEKYGAKIDKKDYQSKLETLMIVISVGKAGVI